MRLGSSFAQSQLTGFTLCSRSDPQQISSRSCCTVPTPVPVGFELGQTLASSPAPPGCCWGVWQRLRLHGRNLGTSLPHRARIASL